MGFMDMAAARFSCRKYDGRPVEEAQLRQIVEAGILAPSGCNAQPWKFIIINDPEAKEKVCDALVLDNGDSAVPFRADVGAYIAVIEEQARVMPMVENLYKGTQRYAQGDLGMAVLNMCYMADELGLRTCILGVINQEKMEKHFGIPEGREVRMILAVGHSERTAPAKSRKGFDEVCTFNHY